jgi:hypothetical protein
MLRGYMQNHAGAQKHVQEDKKIRRRTELYGGLYLASRLHKCESSLNQLINIPHSNVFLTCLVSCVDGA